METYARIELCHYGNDHIISSIPNIFQTTNGSSVQTTTRVEGKVIIVFFEP